MNSSPPPPRPRAERLDAMTGVRALAAWAVVVLHWSVDVGKVFPWWPSIHHVTDQGELGVDLFFMLSGFILVHNYHLNFARFSWDEYWRFLWLRFARVYPAYLAALLAMISLVVAAMLAGTKYRQTSYSLEILPWEFLMLHAWRPGEFIGGWNYPDWSVSAEWFAYTLLFVPTILVINRLKSAWLATGLAVVALGIYNYALGHGGRPNRLGHELSYITLYFIAGALGWRVWRAWGDRVNRLRGASLGLWLPMLGMLAVIVAPGGYPGWRCTGLAVLMWLYLLTLGLPDHPPAKLHAHRWLVYWGEASYALYLSHGVVIRMVKALADPAKYAGASLGLRLAWLSGGLALTVLAAMALHHLVEEPARKWLRRIGPKAPAKINS
jgi:peptidoglycan/LPS O-acetylase OafA/YrhL